MATAEDPDTGELRLDAANIVLHYYTLDFLAKCCEPDGGVQASLVYHVARKKVPAVSPDGATTETPAKPNGVKLEAFIFDVYQYAEKVAFLRGDRREDFAPVKNAEGTGKDSGHGTRGGFRASPRMDRERGRTCRGRGTRRGGAGGVVRGRGTRGYLRGTHVRRGGVRGGTRVGVG